MVVKEEAEEAVNLQKEKTPEKESTEDSDCVVVKVEQSDTLPTEQKETEPVVKSETEIKEEEIEKEKKSETSTADKKEVHANILHFYNFIINIYFDFIGRKKSC